MSVVKPLLLGYQRVFLDTTDSAFAYGQRTLDAFAWREGFELAEIYVERGVSCSALEQLLMAADMCETLGAIAVPMPSDLGGNPHVQMAMRKRLVLATGVPVHVAGHLLTQSRRRRVGRD